MKDAEDIYLQVERKLNSKRKDTPSLAYIKNAMRKRVEASISDIKKLFLRTIHATTIKGFLLKIVLYIFAIQLKHY